MGNALVCQGALCQCTQGSAPASLAVTSQMILEVENVLVATVNDFAPVANVPPFGSCAVLMGPCVPATASPWSPGSEIETVNNLAVLTANSKLMCSVGGEISVQNPANELEESS